MTRLLTVQSCSGYDHPRYAASFAEFGRPEQLPRSGGWILRRRISGSSYDDAMGCYPLFTCQNWQGLRDDLCYSVPGLVSLALVTDPFGEYDENYLHECFGDVVRPFKEHFVIDLRRQRQTFVSAHHRQNARRALQAVSVENCTPPERFLNEWVELYSTLINRHSIRGITAFSRSAFAAQMSVPGLVTFRAVHRQATVGMALWYVRNGVGYYHLGASTELGYRLRASFAIFWQAIEYFAHKLEWLNLGAGAGLSPDSLDGLARFKRGWATGTRTAYFCGKIVDREKYWTLASSRNEAPANYFPVYRQGEFS